MPLATAAPSVSYSYALLFFLVFAWALCLAGLVLVLAIGGKGPPRRRNLAIIALALAFASLTGVLGYGAIQYYVNQNVAQNTWTFRFWFTIQGNSTAREAVILPVVQDESLLKGIQLASGTANWSFVDTARGRGLYVVFAGAATLESYLSVFPRPSVLPDSTVTLADTSNGTTWPNARMWVYYAGTAGGSFSLSIQNWYTNDHLQPGWFAYAVWPPAVP